MLELPEGTVLSESELAMWKIAIDYFKDLETAKTVDVCWCKWTTNPSNETQKARINEHPLCPVHTREGMALAFVKHLNQQERWRVKYRSTFAENFTLDVHSTRQGTTATSPTDNEFVRTAEETIKRLHKPQRSSEPVEIEVGPNND